MVSRRTTCSTRTSRPGTSLLHVVDTGGHLLSLPVSHPSALLMSSLAIISPTKDRFLVYLLVVQVLEYIVELVVVFVGISMRLRTRQDLHRCLSGTAKEIYNPSVMVGVPAVWKSIRKGIVAKVNSGPGNPITKAIPNGALYVFLRSSRIALYLSKVGTATGGRLRIALGGGAAMSRDTNYCAGFRYTTLFTCV